VTFDAPSIPAILQAGRALLERNQPSQVSMASVAAASGFSRMAVYRHFGSRAGLLTALLASIDEEEGAEASVRAVLAAGSAHDVVTNLFAWWSGYVPRFAGVARGVLASKHADADLHEAWDVRMLALRQVCEAVARQCVQVQGGATEFVDELLVLMSVPLWLQLADEGWTTDRYTRTMTGMALAALGRHPGALLQGREFRRP
jgi:AcrR family transcriptional regulator